MCDKKTHIPIKEFDSISDAIKFLGLKKSCNANILATTKGRKKSAYGFFWKQKD